MTRRAAIYCRISRDRAGAELGVDRQENDCRALAKKLGWEIAAVYRDNDISAYSGKKRPGYLALLADLEAGRADAVIAWHSDRLHRSPAELERYITVCETRSAPTATVTASPLDLTTPSGRMVARMLGAAARGEVEHTIERIKRAKLQSAMDGRWRGGRRPFGYAADGVTLEPAEAAELARAADAVLAGSSLRSIAADLNTRGVTTSTGRAWTPIELKRVLARARNAGLVDHRGEIVSSAVWPAILTEGKWRAITALLSDPARRTTPGPAPRWLLSGIAKCGIDGCGARMIVCLATGPSRSWSQPAYTCSARKHLTRDASRLDEHVTSLIVERLSRPDAIDLLARDAPVDTAALHMEALGVRQQLDELGLMFARRELDARQVAIASKDLRAQLERVERAIAAASRQSVFRGVVGTGDVAANWEGLALDRRRAIIQALVTVTVLKSRRGRPPGWRPGAGYFSTESVAVVPVTA